MTSRKSFLSFVLIVFVFSNVSMAVMCSRLKDVSAGENHTLALMEDNTLWACGSGPLGLGSGVSQVLALQRVHGPNDVGYLEDINDFDAGWEHSMAADSNGTIWAWGDDYYGQLGNGVGQDNADVPEKVHGVNDVGYLSDTVDIIYVSAGRSGQHSLAVDSNGYVYAWGRDDYGQCGDGSSNTREEIPVPVLDDDPNTDGVYLGDVATIIATDAGVDHSIALDDEGHVWEWGRNNSSSIPKKVKGEGGAGYLENIVAISTCYDSMALDGNGNVWTWTSGYPVKVPGGEMGTTYLENIVAIAAGNYKMALDSNGNVWEWTGSSPVKVQDGEMETELGYLEGIIAIDSGFYDHKLAVCENGYGWAWGSNNNYGKFGVGDTNPRIYPAMMLCAEISESIYLTKTAEIQGSEPNCVRPFIGMGLEDNYLVYDICYGNPVTDPNDPNYYGTVYDVNIIDRLPIEVDFYSASHGGIYDANEHAVTWIIGDLAPGDSNCFTLTTKVNNYARPGGEISNFVEMTADMYYSYTTNVVPVCNWGSEIIYVDKDANGYNNGTSWDDAYTDLQDGLTGARNCGAAVTAIWVAAGTYKPIWDANDMTMNETFELIEDVGLFGHFGGIGTYETSTMQRNFADANNETIIDGKIGEGYYEKVYYPITAVDIEDAIVDGFTIRGGYTGGVKMDSADVGVVNCKIKNNNSYGIYAFDYSYPDIHNCLFIDNSSYGISSDYSWLVITDSIFDGNNITQRATTANTSHIELTDCIVKDHTGNSIYVSDTDIEIEGCSIKNNGNCVYCSDSNTIISHSLIERNPGTGIYCLSGSTLIFTNNVIRWNGDYGIYLSDMSSTTIKNNWIHNNGADGSGAYDCGIYFADQNSQPLVRNNTIIDNLSYGIYSYSGTEPNVVNCIIYENGTQIGTNGEPLENVKYSCIEGGYPGTGNISSDPSFMNPTDPNDLHLAEISPCKDTGDPNGNYDDETDIDGEDRIKYGYVDIGGDEYYWSPADFNEDGTVNFIDYAIFASAWQSEPNDNNYNEDCDLEDNNSIDYKDLALFCEDWLWEVAWDNTQWWMMMGGSGGSFGLDGLGGGLLGTESLETVKQVEVKKIDSLKITDAKVSKARRPERLAAKSQKFYDITPATTISARRKALEIVKIDIKKILKWLDEIWLDEEVRKVIDEDKWLKFMESLKEGL